MLYILWVIVNIGLLLYFLYVLYKAIVVVKREMGLFPVIFLTIIIASQCNHSRVTDKNNNQTCNGISTRLYSHKIKLSPINSLIIDCAMDSTGNVIYKRSDLSGTVVGVDWKELTVAANDNQYSIVGTLEWNLIGIRIWSQFKRFDGTFTKEDVIWDQATGIRQAFSTDTSEIKTISKE